MENIDYEYWCALDKWTIEEAALLLDGKEPYAHPEFKLQREIVQPEYTNAKRIAAVIERTDWQRRYGKPAEQIKDDPVYISDAVRHARFPLASALIRELEKRRARDNKFRTIGFKPAPVVNNSAAAKERNSMLKMIIAFAMALYKLDPDSPRNPYAKEMRRDLEKAGLALDDATIKKHIDEGKRVLQKSVEGESD